MCKPTTSSPTVVNRNTMPMPMPTMKRQQQQPSSPPSSSKTTDRKVIRHASVADGGRIRSRFLDRLGISPPVPRSKGRRVGTSCNLPSSPPTHSSNTTRRTRPLMKRQQEPSKQEPLKKDHGQPDESLGPSSYSQTSVSPKNTTSHAFGHRNVKTVSFANAVEVISIPSHQAYSDRIKNTVWTNPTERKQNYARNVLEFSAENWDYRQVVEEDQFYWVATAAAGTGGSGSQKNRGKQEGVMVHPVHLYLQQQQRERQLRWQSFCAVMSAQQKQQHHHQHAMNY